MAVASSKTEYIDITSFGGEEIWVGETPFQDAALATPRQNIVIAQLLVNKMADIDFRMKFLPSSQNVMEDIASAGLGRFVDNQIEGFPQYYVLSGGTFRLFHAYPNISPKLYLRMRYVEKGGVLSRSPQYLYSFERDIFNSPQCLKLNKDGSAFENDFYSIPAKGAMFNMPFGHFIVRDLTGSAVPKKEQLGSISCFRVEGTTPRTGGKFSVHTTPTGDFSIHPVDTAVKLYDEESPKVYTSTDQPLIRSSADKGLYFISPFMEPTIERLMDVPLPPRYGGNLTSTDADVLKKSAKQGVIDGNNRRLTGKAVNLSPDFLVASSKSDLVVKGAPRPLKIPQASPSLPPLYARFEKILSNQFSEPSTCIVLKNAMTAALQMPSGAANGSMSLAFYQIQVTDPAEAAFVGKMLSVGKAA
jgi:hypothetical protein